jgi:hypothetical protein
MNRGFLRRAVLFLARQGIRQFLDLGSGIPTVGNVHEVAQEVDPGIRVVYVDCEPIAVAHSEMILAGNDNVAVVQADMRDPLAVFGSPATKRLIDLTRPVGLLMVGVVQFIADSDDPWAMAAHYRDVLPSGSYLALSAMTTDGAPDGMAEAVQACGFSRDPIHPRPHGEIVRMFEGFEVVEPGVVYTPEWRPERPEDAGDNWERSNMYAGVGYKP